ncbi:hypothetical protein [Hymenobacter sp. YC55]|uniref:hypothetical protein n=1 Tax=Hymenobacter sp. YC55 TaxID=3034019 RepID=UPI0023F84DB7|nr:hypothetical protein [Hymenobacter sp. YC55]MDF7815340.1 hypothetical protein [Hymenobacter sp. YC55]
MTASAPATAGQLVEKSSTLFVVGQALGAGTLLAYLSFEALSAAYGQKLPKTVQVLTVSSYEVCVLPGMANYWAKDVEAVKATRTATLRKEGAAPQPQPLAPVSKADMISRILSTASQAAIVSNRAGEFQGLAANTFITLAFKSEDELGSICKKIGAIH